jgi:hypothetical protein
VDEDGWMLLRYCFRERRHYDQIGLWLLLAQAHTEWLEIDIWQEGLSFCGWWWWSVDHGLGLEVIPSRKRRIRPERQHKTRRNRRRLQRPGHGQELFWQSDLHIRKWEMGENGRWKSVEYCYWLQGEDV